MYFKSWAVKGSLTVLTKGTARIWGSCEPLAPAARLRPWALALFLTGEHWERPWPCTWVTGIAVTHWLFLSSCRLGLDQSLGSGSRRSRPPKIAAGGLRSDGRPLLRTSGAERSENAERHLIGDFISSPGCYQSSIEALLFLSGFM